jgi:hypothetical protein
MLHSKVILDGHSESTPEPDASLSQINKSNRDSQHPVTRSDRNFGQYHPYSASEIWLTTIQSALSTPDSNDVASPNFLGTNMVWPEVDSAISNPCQDAIIPSSMESCECCPVPLLSTPHRGERLNLWRFANETLTEPTGHSGLVITRENELADDTPIRAMIGG